MTPSDAGFQDRYIVQEIIKEMAKNRPIDAKGKKAFKGNKLAVFVFNQYLSASALVCMTNVSNLGLQASTLPFFFYPFSLPQFFKLMFDVVIFQY